MACETFCIEENDMVKDAKKAFGRMPLTEETVRFSRADKKSEMKTALEQSCRKHLITCKINEIKHLGENTTDRATVFVEMEANVSVTRPLNTYLYAYKLLRSFKYIVSFFLG